MLNQRLVLVFILSWLALLATTVRAVEEIKIGVLVRHRGLEEPLNRTLDMLNADASVLLTTRLVAIIEVLETDNSYQTSLASKYLQNHLPNSAKLSDSGRLIYNFIFSLQVNIAKCVDYHWTSINPADANNSINNSSLSHTIGHYALAALLSLYRQFDNQQQQ